jgi:hypothetical protein
MSRARCRRSNAITLDTSNKTLEIASNLTISGAETVAGGTLQLDAGSSLTDTSGITVSSGTLLGQGTVNVGAGTLTGSGSGVIKASGGTLNLTGTNGQVNGGSALQVADVSGSVPKISTTGSNTSNAITLDTSNKTLEIASNRTISGAETVAGGTLQLDAGSSLTDTSGITVSSGTLVGQGTVNVGAGTLTGSGSGVIKAWGGTLNLEFDGAVGTATINPNITFFGGFSNPPLLDLSNLSGGLANFHGIVQSFDVNEGIKVNGAASASASLNGSNSTLTVLDASSHSLGTITLAGTAYTSDTFNVDSSGIITISTATTLSGNVSTNISSGTFVIQPNTTATLSGGTVSGSPNLDVSSGSTLTVSDTIASGSSPTFNLSGGTHRYRNGCQRRNHYHRGQRRDYDRLQHHHRLVFPYRRRQQCRVSWGNLTTTFTTIKDTAIVVLTPTNNLNPSSTVTFAAGSTLKNQGTLVIDNTAAFKGTIFGFTGSGITNSDKLELLDFGGTITHSYNSTTGALTLTGVNVSTGKKISATINFDPTTTTGNLGFGSDAGINTNITGYTGQGTLIWDPPLSAIATIASGTSLEIASASAQEVLFANSVDTSGTLQLDDSAQFTGQISEFAGTATSSDAIDLKTSILPRPRRGTPKAATARAER